MKRDSDRRCSECIYFDETEYIGIGYGTCRRRSPHLEVIIVSEDGDTVQVHQHRWPRIHHAEWCGEWNGRDDS